MRLRWRNFALLSLVLVPACSDVEEGENIGTDQGHLGSTKPTNTERFLSCPLESTVSDGFAPSSEAPILDDEALKAAAPSNVKVTVILIRRVKGVPVYRYLSNGTSNDVFQPWSSSKFVTAAAAASKLRDKSGGKVGLTAKVDDIPLGDLVTVVASYREDRYTSNGLAHYFLNIGGRNDVKSLVTNWLNRPNESLGGNYGAPAPDLDYSFTDGLNKVDVTPDEGGGINNSLSSRTLAEFMKRIAVWDDANTHLGKMQEADVKTLLYGPEKSAWWPNDPWGGLSADIATPVEKALDLEKVEADSKGRWRIFGKVGWGDGGGARGSERVNVTYTCLPALDAAGKPLRDKGAEFVIATKVSSTSGESAATSAATAAHDKIINQVVLKQAQTEGPYTKDGFPEQEQDKPGEPSDESSDDPPHAANKGSSGTAEPASEESDAEAGCSVPPGKHGQGPLLPVVMGLVFSLVRLRRRN
jgi:hypothetical protein